jgi:hypothetical protein
MKLMTPYEQAKLMNNLYHAFGTQQAVADALHVSQQVFNYWLHVARRPPYEKVLEMQKLWEKIKAEKELETPKEEHSDRILKCQKENSQSIGALFNNEKGVKLNKPLLDMNKIYSNKKLKEAEERLHMPLRTIFAILLTYCCDSHGEFPLNPNTLKEQILPYVDIDFSAAVNALCNLGLVEDFLYQKESYGFIALEDYACKPSFSEAREQINQRLEFLHDAQHVMPSYSKNYH